MALGNSERELSNGVNWWGNEWLPSYGKKEQGNVEVTLLMKNLQRIPVRRLQQIQSGLRKSSPVRSNPGIFYVYIRFNPITLESDPEPQWPGTAWNPIPVWLA